MPFPQLSGYILYLLMMYYNSYMANIYFHTSEFTMSLLLSIRSSSALIHSSLLASLLFIAYNPAHAENEHAPSMHHGKSHHEQMQHGNGEHGGGHHGGHGAIAKGIEKFPTTSYTDNKPARDIERPPVPAMQGDPVKGKQLATGNKGRCLSCHVIDVDSDQAGDVGPSLSTYAMTGRSRDYSFQQVWDARAHNPNSLMPPFGTNGLLSAHEILHIIAYLDTLKVAVMAPARPQLDTPDYYIAGEDLTLADVYIEEGLALFNQPGHNGQSCASCHAPTTGTALALTGIATSYPKYDNELKKLMLIETRNNHCRQKYMQSQPYKHGSRESNTLSAYVKFLARNIPIKLARSVASEKALLRGKQSFYKKTGQLNLSCADCHVRAAGKWLRGQSLSSIQPTGAHSYTAATWPRHFIALHDLGLISLQQRIRHCQIVTQTYPQDLGSDEYIDMELYITDLATGKPMQAPTMSKPRGAE